MKKNGARNKWRISNLFSLISFINRFLKSRLFHINTNEKIPEARYKAERTASKISDLNDTNCAIALHIRNDPTAVNIMRIDMVTFVFFIFAPLCLLLLNSTFMKGFYRLTGILKALAAFFLDSSPLRS